MFRAIVTGYIYRKTGSLFLVTQVCVPDHQAKHEVAMLATDTLEGSYVIHKKQFARNFPCIPNKQLRTVSGWMSCPGCGYWLNSAHSYSGATQRDTCLWRVVPAVTYTLHPRSMLDGRSCPPSARFYWQLLKDSQVQSAEPP